jgi:hypothetical protein
MELKSVLLLVVVFAQGCGSESTATNQDKIARICDQVMVLFCAACVGTSPLSCTCTTGTNTGATFAIEQCDGIFAAVTQTCR